MQTEKKCYIEKTAEKAKKWIRANKTAFFAVLIIGLMCHMFMFTNKLVNHDDICNLFGKGATISSGRWGLVLLETIFPDYSMPWIYGVVSLVLLAIAVCLIVNLFSIKNRILQILLAGLIVTFPSLTGTFCYMFTAAPYALSFLLAVAAVVLFEKGGWKRILGAAVLAIFSLSIYQAYISIIASFFIIRLIQKIVSENTRPKEILCHGMQQVLFLVAVLVAYYSSVQLILLISGTGFNEYASDNFSAGSVNLLRRVYVAYVNFMYFFTRGNWGLINTPVSCVMHLLFIGVVAVMTLRARRGKPMGSTLLMGLLIVLLPLAINCMYLIVEEEAVHSLVLYGFAAVYVLAAILCEEILKNTSLPKDLVLLAFMIILINNVYVSNEDYLSMHLAYENAHSFYTSVITQVKQTPGFDENKKLALIGRAQELVYDSEEFRNSRIMGVDRNLINVYTREEFVKYYIGFDISFATEEEIAQIMETEEYRDMKEYPWYGSVAIIGDYVVVNFGVEE